MTSRPPPVALHFPRWINNPYQLLLSRGLEGAGWTVVLRNYPNGVWGLSNALRDVPEAQVLHLHWLTPYLAQFMWVRNGVKFRIKAFALRIDLARIRRSGRRIVWTVHNEVSHESSTPEREIALNTIVAEYSHQLVFHSDQAIDQFEQTHRISVRPKAAVIPHGNYIGWYKDDPVRQRQIGEELGLNGNQRIYLVFGAIRKYKGIPQIISAFRRTRDPDLRLLIVGKPRTQSLAEEICRGASGDSRIVLRLGFVSDEDVAPLFALSHALVLGVERILTSGAAVLGMSLGRALVLPENARVIEAAPESGTWFYRGEEELAALFEALSHEDLGAAGTVNRGAAQALNWNLIGAKTAELYR